MQPSTPWCFDGGSDPRAYSDGTWTPWHGASSPPYALRPDLMHILGLPAKANAWGTCAQKNRSHPAGLQTRGTTAAVPLDLAWRPRRCRLHQLRHPQVCDMLVHRGGGDGNLSMLLVGDSVTSQVFLSLVHLLHGHVGVNADSSRTGALTDVMATACDGKVRINFVRSDLLLWTPTAFEHNRVMQCERGYVGKSFIRRASHHSDFVFLHVGHHHVAALDYAQVGSMGALKARHASLQKDELTVHDAAARCGCLSRKKGRTGSFSLDVVDEKGLRRCQADSNMNCSHFQWQMRAVLAAKVQLAAAGRVDQAGREAFFARNLNHTLASLLAARTASGYPHASVALIGPTAPIPGCDRFYEPLELDVAELTMVEPDSDDAVLSARARSPFLPRWVAVRAQVQVAASLAAGLRTRFLDLTTLTSTRPDGALGGQGRGGDCLHYCLPGPTDAIAELLYNVVVSAPVRAPAHTSSSGFFRADNATLNARLNSGFFRVDNATLLSKDGRRIADHLEIVAGPQDRQERDNRPGSKWWWPFPASRTGPCGCTRKCLPVLELSMLIQEVAS